jgi:hypothetical protein
MRTVRSFLVCATGLSMDKQNNGVNSQCTRLHTQTLIVLLSIQLSEIHKEGKF